DDREAPPRSRRALGALGPGAGRREAKRAVGHVQRDVHVGRRRTDHDDARLDVPGDPSPVAERELAVTSGAELPFGLDEGDEPDVRDAVDLVEMRRRADGQLAARAELDPEDGEVLLRRLAPERVEAGHRQRLRAHATLLA